MLECFVSISPHSMEHNPRSAIHGAQPTEYSPPSTIYFSIPSFAPKNVSAPRGARSTHGSKISLISNNHLGIRSSDEQALPVRFFPRDLMYAVRYAVRCTLYAVPPSIH